MAYAKGRIADMRRGRDVPVRSDAGAVVGFTKVVQDCTAQRRAQDAAEHERRSLQILNRAGSALAIETDLTRLVQIVTDAGVELRDAEFGAFFYNLIDEAGESYARSVLEISHAAQYPGVWAHLQR
jgi:hypothetical protein